MLLVLAAAALFSPLFWLITPSRLRRATLALASLVGLAMYDPRLPVLILGVTLALFLVLHVIDGAGESRRPWIAGAGLAALTALFVWNKLSGGRLAVLPSQHGIAFLGVSYLVLKAAAVMIETARGAIKLPSYADLLAWIAFLPTYPSGPMEEIDHFRRQSPTLDRNLVLGGLERILIGLMKALLGAHYLGEWVEPIVAAPATESPAVLLLGLYAVSVRFYLDFSGYSDIAIGLGAIFGYDIEENFDNPFVRRNLVQLWQRWHMTLTRWLRLYLFIPISRRIMRRRPSWGDLVAVAAGQIGAMTFCGLWHGLGWNFALWGLLHALGLIWVGTVCRRISRLLPSGLVRWWRQSPEAYAMSTFITFNAFALASVFLVTDVAGALTYLRHLFGAG